MLAHSYVDLRQKDLVSEAGLPQLTGDGYIERSALKLMEDELVYPKRFDWSNLIACFAGGPLAQEQALVPAADIAVWNAALTTYLKAPPTLDSAEHFLQAIRMPDNIRSAILARLQELKKQPDLQSRVAAVSAAWDEEE